MRYAYAKIPAALLVDIDKLPAKIIYLPFTVKPGIDLVTAQNIAENALYAA